MELQVRTCKRCGHQWFARTEHLPQRCPKCRARNWLKGERTLADRFWEKVQKGPDCWLWTASCFPHGYGQFRVGDTNVPAQRVVWQLTYGPIPDGINVCHHCDNPPCVRPDHLFLGTAKDNNHDAAFKGRLRTGERSPRAKLTWEQVNQIRELWAVGINQQALAAMFPISDSQVSNIVRHRSWRLPQEVKA